MNFVETETQKLLNGIDGSIVVQNIKDHYSTHYSFEKNVSNVRRSFLKHDKHHPNFEEDVQTIENLIANCVNTELKENSSQLFNKFKNMNLEQKFDTLKRTNKKGFCSGFYELNEKMKEIRLLPDNLHTFCINDDDNQLSQQKKRKTLIERNKSYISVQNADNLLDTQIDVLRNGSSCKIDEIMALLFVSGRRECEILNGKSTFEEVPNRPYLTSFKGALKKKKNYLQDEEDSVYTIPLLCLYSDFIHALNRMRKNQSDDIKTLTNKQVSNRYCGQLKIARKRIFPQINKTHDLRGIYMKYVELLFNNNVAFPLLCMLCLGHDIIEDSLHYMSIHLYDPLLKNKYGNLYVEEFIQWLENIS